MDEQRARKVLRAGGFLTGQDWLMPSMFDSERDFEPRVELDGYPATAEELDALAWWMRNKTVKQATRR